MQENKNTVLGEFKYMLESKSVFFLLFKYLSVYSYYIVIMADCTTRCLFFFFFFKTSGRPTATVSPGFLLYCQPCSTEDETGQGQGLSHANRAWAHINPSTENTVRETCPSMVVFTLIKCGLWPRVQSRHKIRYFPEFYCLKMTVSKSFSRFIHRH